MPLEKSKREYGLHLASCDATASAVGYFPSSILLVADLERPSRQHLVLSGERSRRTWENGSRGAGSAHLVNEVLFMYENYKHQEYMLIQYIHGTFNVDEFFKLPDSSPASSADSANDSSPSSKSDVGWSPSVPLPRPLPHAIPNLRSRGKPIRPDMRVFLALWCT